MKAQQENYERVDASPTLVDSTSGLGSLDTCRGSIIHWIFRIPSPGQPVHWLRSVVYPYAIVSLLFGLIPIGIILWQRFTRNMPFVLDYNLVCMSLLTLPLVTVMLLTERSLVASRIDRVRSRGILVPKNSQSLRSRWELIFFRVNIAGQIFAILIGAAISSINYSAWTHNAPTSLWALVESGSLTFAGWMMLLWLLPVFYFICVIYVVRALATTAMLWGIVENSEVKPQPFHGDNSGGLSSIARIGLRNQYVLAIAGINIVCFVSVARSLMQTTAPHSGYLLGFLIAATLFYLVAAPIVFICPLLPFRKSMREEKARLLESLGDGVRNKVNQIITRMEKEPPTKEDEEVLERFSKMSDLVGHCPVWPFDTVTLRRFLTAYLVPLITGVATLPPVVEAIGKLMGLVHMR